MREIALSVYRKCVQKAAGYGLDNVRIVHALHGHMLRRLRPESVTVFGKRLYLDDADSLNLSIHGAHEPDTTALLKSLVRDGDTVLDIGAHIGYFTLLMAGLAGDSGRVIAFEAHPDNAALLRKTIVESGYNNVVIENKATTSRTGSLYLIPDREGTVDHRTTDVLEGPEQIGIEGVALDDYFDATTKVDVIKMDIQGAEGHALRGMERLVARQDRLTLITEFEPWGLDESGIGARRYLEMLRDFGFTVYDLRSRDDEHLAVGPDTLCGKYPPIKDAFTNLYCVKGTTPPTCV